VTAVRRGLVVCLTVSLLVVSAPAGAVDATPPDVPPETIDPAQARLDSLNGAIGDLDTQVIFAKSKLKVNEDYLRKLEAYAADWTRYLEALQSRITIVERQAARAVTALYQRGEQGSAAFYAAVMGSGHPHEAFTAARYLSGSLRRQRSRVEDLGRLRAQAGEVAREASAKTAEVAQAQTKLAEDRKKLERLRSQVSAVRSKKKVEDKRERVLMAQVQQKKEEYLREVALLESESSAIAKWLRGVQAKQRVALRRPRTFVLPAGGPFSSGFGLRTHPVYGDVRLHTGVDFSARPGTPVLAGGGGTVIWAGSRGGYGNLVVIDHGNGLATLYAHQSRLRVGQGQVVAAGEHIGDVGSTGLSTGPHLHFEVREKGSPVDPVGYL
jgi:murein DD-endopeptidase MepM/ murein hydrolase activator NlpD